MARALLLLLLAVLVAQVDTAAATADSELRAATYYLGRADPRACPSPRCGGIWLTAVNGADGGCAAPPSAECYVTGLDAGHAHLDTLVASGGGLVLGRVAPTRLQGFPDLRELRAVTVWRPAGKRMPTGVFRRLRDNGVRCITTPCFSVTATALNSGRATTVSSVDLRAAGASAAERQRAQALVAGRGLLAAGRIVRSRDRGRTFVASRLYLPAR